MFHLNINGESNHICGVGCTRGRTYNILSMASSKHRQKKKKNRNRSHSRPFNSSLNSVRMPPKCAPKHAHSNTNTEPHTHRWFLCGVLYAGVPVSLGSTQESLKDTSGHSRETEPKARSWGRTRGNTNLYTKTHGNVSLAAAQHNAQQSVRMVDRKRGVGRGGTRDVKRPLSSRCEVRVLSYLSCCWCVQKKCTFCPALHPSYYTFRHVRTRCTCKNGTVVPIRPPPTTAVINRFLEGGVGDRQ